MNNWQETLLISKLKNLSKKPNMSYWTKPNKPNQTYLTKSNLPSQTKISTFIPKQMTPAKRISVDEERKNHRSLSPYYSWHLQMWVDGRDMSTVAVASSARMSFKVGGQKDSLFPAPVSVAWQ